MCTEKKPENPNAFPSNYHDTYNGMTLRDYFANSAIQNPVSYKPRNLYQWFRWVFGYSYKACSRPHDENAIQAYELADAMLKKREL